MKIRRHRTFQIKVQEYESYGFGAVAERDPSDYGETEQSVAEMTPAKRKKFHDKMKQDVENELDEMLVDEIAFAKELSNFRKSYIHSLED